jgi:hypothetical protein
MRLRIPLPPKLEVTGDIAGHWKRCKRMWQNYEIVTRLDGEPTEYRAATFLSCVGPEALDVFEGLPFADEAERSNIDKILELFEQYCLGEVNETYESYMFLKRTQNKGESIDLFVADLRRLIKTCNYGTFADRLLRDKIVIGIRDETLRSKLLEVRDLTLKRCIDMCRAYETSQQQSQMMMSGACGESQEVRAVQKTDGNHSNRAWGRNAPNKNTSRTSNTRRDGHHKSCHYCGNSHIPKKEMCPAYGKTCMKCKGRNHFAVVCTRPAVNKMNNVDMQDSDSDSDAEGYMFGVSDNNDSKSTTSSVQATMVIGGKDVCFLLDSGATTNVMSAKTYKGVTNDIQMRELRRTKRKLVMFNGTEMKPIGVRVLSFVNPKTDKTYDVEFVITQETCSPILGCRASQVMELITVRHENIATMSASEPNIIKEYEDVFEGEGKIEGLLHLVTDPNAIPVKMPCRKWPVSVQEKVKDELDRLTELGVVTAVDTPTDWISSLVVVVKPNGKVRLCIDPQPLNKALKRNEYPMPTLDDNVLPLLQGAKYFTHLDAKNGFWHVELDTDSSYLTTFETPFGKYRWTRMPFGIAPAPEEFQRRISSALAGLPGVVAIHDDIILVGKGDTDAEGSEDHDTKLQELLKRCRKQGIRLNKDKVELKQTEVSYLGHKLSREGLKADPSKIDAVQNLQTPEDKPAVLRLLGMVGYLQKFAPNLSEAAAPLRELVKKYTHFRWDEQVHGKALERVKKILAEPPVLRYFDSSRDVATTLQCDASEFGLGRVLCRMDNLLVMHHTHLQKLRGIMPRSRKKCWP